MNAALADTQVSYLRRALLVDLARWESWTPRLRDESARSFAAPRRRMLDHLRERGGAVDGECAILLLDYAARRSERLAGGLESLAEKRRLQRIIARLGTLAEPPCNRGKRRAANRRRPDTAGRRR